MFPTLRPASSSMDGESRPTRTGRMFSHNAKRPSLARPSSLLFRRPRLNTIDTNQSDTSERSATEATSADSIIVVHNPSSTATNNRRDNHHHEESPALVATPNAPSLATSPSSVTTTRNTDKKNLIRQLSRRAASSFKSKATNKKHSPATRMKDMDIDTTVNALQWMERSCPRDVAPKILAFCGPQMTYKLMATNRFWYQLIAKEDGTWRSMCEGMYKWKEGDELPESWKDYYRLHPCVPVDYPSIPKAMAVANPTRSKSSRSSTRRQEQVRSVHVLLRPGTHLLHHSLAIQAIPLVKVTIETMQLPTTRFYSPRLAMEEYQALQLYPLQQAAAAACANNSRAAQWRERLGCRSHAEGDTERRAYYYSEALLDANGEDDHVMMNESDDDDDMSILATTPPKQPTRATIVLNTRRANVPIFRVLQGTLRLKNVDLQHSSSGVDIWNGNAAVQVQPPLGQDDQPLMVVPRPCAILEGVAVTSDSGRGIVNIDGGHLSVSSSCIHSCAATGIYIGGPGSQAEVDASDVIGNGIGSRQRRGIGAGHSGIYLEQGLTRITNCNVSENSLTGISSVSPENAILWLENSDLMANGSYQLEMPYPESVARRSSVTKNNNLCPTGEPEMRSQLTISRTRAASTDGEQDN